MKMAGQASPAFLLYHTLWCALDWIFPPSCGGCGQPGFRWCGSCQEKVTRVLGPVCTYCGDPLKNNDPQARSAGLLCPDCQSQPPPYQALRSYGLFSGPIREALHHLKYQRDIGIGEPLSKHLVELYNELKWDIDLIIPVPLSQKRLKERGYNQSAMLAWPLSNAVQKPYLPSALQRARNTQTQVGLNANERRQNVEGAFTASGDKVKGKVVLVIDDVMTTGSTISACTQALRIAGASAVYALTLARAVSKTDTDDRNLSSDSNGGKNGSRGRDIS